MQLVQSQPTFADFNADLIQAQREALNALREVMAETADPADDDNTRLDDDDLQTRTARFRRLSLRLRAATAVLRVKPLAEAPPSEPPATRGARADASTHTPSAHTGDPTRKPAAVTPDSPTPHAAARQSRRTDDPPLPRTALTPTGSSPSRPSFRGVHP